MSAVRSSRPASPAIARERLIHVIQGEFAIVDQPDAILTTLLGSCVAVCMRDPVSGVGGMNHFLLPGDASSGNESVKYGVNAMELLINGLLQRGGLRSRLEAKLFGGGHVIANASNAIGEKNAEFAKRFLDAEGIRCVGESLGGEKARRVRYWPSTGRASQLLLDSSPPEVIKADRPKPKPPVDNNAGAVELF